MVPIEPISFTVGAVSLAVQLLDGCKEGKRLPEYREEETILTLNRMFVPPGGSMSARRVSISSDSFTV